MNEKRKLLITCLLGALLLPACTFHHSVPIRYTPLIQSKRLADPNNPQVVVIGDFKDARTSTGIGKERLNPISVHKLEFRTVVDGPTIVRSAFLDGFLKSGFQVPSEGEAAPNPLLNVTGKVVTYAVDSKTGWSKVTMTADVAVEVTLTDRNGVATVLSASGKGLLRASRSDTTRRTPTPSTAPFRSLSRTSSRTRSSWRC